MSKYILVRVDHDKTSKAGNLYSRLYYVDIGSGVGADCFISGDLAKKIIDQELVVDLSELEVASVELIFGPKGLVDVKEVG